MRIKLVIPVNYTLSKNGICGPGVPLALLSRQNSSVGLWLCTTPASASGASPLGLAKSGSLTDPDSHLPF